MLQSDRYQPLLNQVAATGKVPVSERIEIQPGDVIGFYLEINSSNSLNKCNDGIQYAGDGESLLTCSPDYRNESVWSAAGPMIERPTVGSLCAGPDRVLSSFTDRAPLITVTVCK